MQRPTDLVLNSTTCVALFALHKCCSCRWHTGSWSFSPRVHRTLHSWLSMHISITTHTKKPCFLQHTCITKFANWPYVGFHGESRPKNLQVPPLLLNACGSCKVSNSPAWVPPTTTVVRFCVPSRGMCRGGHHSQTRKLRDVGVGSLVVQRSAVFATEDQGAAADAAGDLLGAAGR
eukprot:COSAG02_NODE_1028_length_15086_cov_21.563555_4_plen_176_part_00